MTGDPTLDRHGTTRLADELAERLGRRRAEQAAAAMFGATVGDDGVRLAVWVPDRDPGTEVVFEILKADTPVDAGAAETTTRFSVHRLPATMVGDVAVAAVKGVRAGDRTAVGDLYRVAATIDGTRHTFPDPLAASTPFGATGPGEILDWRSVDAGRSDAGHYAAFGTSHPDDEPPRRPAPTAILQVHVGTATPDGTLAALTRKLRAIAARVGDGAEPSPEDAVWLGYDAIELMPVEPTIPFEAGPPCWEEVQAEAEAGRDGAVVVTHRRPATTGWGYDVLIAGSAAVNPALLERGRPHELAELAAALHEMPGGPVQLILDVVYGHADNQAVGVLQSAWLTGPDMYGQHLDYRNPMVTAQLLEMQRRKGNFGADAIRVDGAQDFTWWDDDGIHFDDDYMEAMSGVVHEVAGHRYRAFMIFEDGRPWPRPDWELASTYRAVIDRQDHVVQWGPLTFAHNTPFLFTFWASKWWRIREITEVGSAWISGCANHDTVRRGMQVDPAARVNAYLGATPQEIIRNAYDHTAATMLFHGFLPGIPMDFVNASMRGAWSFIRNTDDRYAIKVWAEEAAFLDWHVTTEQFEAPDAFPRLKALGFDDLEGLRRFMAHLAAAVALHDDDGPVPALLNGTDPSLHHEPLDVALLRRAARAWMDDVHEYCVVERWSPDPVRAATHLAVRRFRRSRPWLRSDLRPGDSFDYRHPTAGSMIVAGARTAPSGSEEVLIVANLEGAPAVVVPTELAGTNPEGWRPAVVGPGQDAYPRADREIRLPDGSGILFTRG